MTRQEASQFALKHKMCTKQETVYLSLTNMSRISTWVKANKPREVIRTIQLDKDLSGFISVMAVDIYMLFVASLPARSV